METLDRAVAVGKLGPYAAEIHDILTPELRTACDAVADFVWYARNPLSSCSAEL
jgi:hypothetical protein